MSWPTAVAAVVGAADGVVEVVLVIGPELVVADDVVSFGVPHDDGLGAVGMLVSFAGGVVNGPAVGVPAGVVDFAALHDEVVQVLVAAVDAGLHLDAETDVLLVFAAPLA